MPSLADSAVIFILALILFGPKRLPQLARQLGKLMAEFRRASNEFRMQMEDELRIEEQKEHQAKVEAMAGPPSTSAEPETPIVSPETEAAIAESAHEFTPESAHASLPEAAPIASSGELRMMPPSTGLPIESANYGTTPKPEPEVTEHSILPPGHSAGIGSDEPHHESANA